MNDRKRQQQKDKEQSPLFSEKSERIVIGEALMSQEFFWVYNGKLKATSFTTPRLARVWQAMVTAAEKGKPPSKTWIPLYIQGDSQEPDNIVFFLNLLINDASEEEYRDPAMHAETVFNLANKRAVLDSLKQAYNRVLTSDFGTPPEHLQDMAMKAIGGALDADGDVDFRSYAEWGLDLWREVAANHDRGEETSGMGLPCGLRAVEEVWGRLLPGKLYVLAGLSGAGKSALAAQIAEAAGAEAKKRKTGIGYVASLEMTGREYATRALAKEMGIGSDVLERGSIDKAAIEALYARARNLDRFNVFVDSKTDMTIDEMGSRMKKARIQKGGLAFAMIDHLIIMGAEKGEGFFDKISRSTIQAKNLAKSLNIPIVMLAQVDETKLMATSSKWPNTNHLFGGANVIKQNADVIGFIHRPEEVWRKLEPRKDDEEKHAKWVARMDRDRGKAVFMNDKRRGGAGGVTRELNWYGETTHFEDI